jgi:hypothetical protein|tara:strand:+ start:51885 stop:52037 length:153 start_codon:yes stop_codon:yes gene_type:complete
MNTIKAVIYTDKDPIKLTLPEVEALFIKKLHKGELNHYEVVSSGKKDKKA